MEAGAVEVAEVVAGVEVAEVVEVDPPLNAIWVFPRGPRWNPIYSLFPFKSNWFLIII